MVAAYSLNNGVTYTVELCTEEDIDVHYEVVRVLVSDTDEQTYKDKMRESVRQGLAMKANGSFLYVHKWRNTWFGDSIYGNDLLGLGLVMKELTDVIGGVKIQFRPHFEKFSFMKSLVTGTSIRLYRHGREYLVVDTAEIRSKFMRLISLYGVADE